MSPEPMPREPSLIEQVLSTVAERERYAAARPNFCQPNCDLAHKVDSAPRRIDRQLMIESRCGRCGRWLGNRPAEA